MACRYVPIRRVQERVSLDAARRRLEPFVCEHGRRLYGAAQCADIIWPGHTMKRQGAGRAAARVLVSLGWRWTMEPDGHNWGWVPPTEWTRRPLPAASERKEA